MARITVEDCLRKENNRFALVVLASKRTKQLLNGAKSLLPEVKNKQIVTSLREIAAGVVRFMTQEELEEARAAENKKFMERSEQVTSAAVAAADELFLTGQKDDFSDLEAELDAIDLEGSDEFEEEDDA
jgi:DNA-directed RNA polymerase subunit omega